MQTRQQAWFCSPPLWLKPAGPSLRTLSTSLIGWLFFDKMENSTESVYLASSRNTFPMFQLWLALHSWCQYLLKESQIFTHWGRFSKVFFSTWCTSFQDFRTFEVISSLTAWVNSIFRPQQKLFLFSCPEQLNRWPCHWLTHWLSDFLFWHYRVSLETCDLWDIWSEWWGDMTWPKNLPTHIPTCHPTCPPTLENILKVQF